MRGLEFASGVLFGVVGLAIASSPSSSEIRKGPDMPVRWAPSGQAEIRMLAQGQNAFIGLLTMDAGAKVPSHQDETEEYIVVLEGGGTITIDGVSSQISSGDAVYMPANATVQFQNQDATIRALQVFAGPEPARKYNQWRAEKP